MAFGTGVANFNKNAISAKSLYTILYAQLQIISFGGIARFLQSVRL
jgi:hypothetical protein